MAKGRNGPTPSNPGGGTATMEPPKKPAKSKKANAGDGGDVLELTVKYGGYNYNNEDGKCRLSFSCDGDSLDPRMARKFLRNVQVEIEMTADPNAEGDRPGQGKLVDDADVHFVGVGDICSWSDGRKRIRSGIVFNPNAVDTLALQKLSGKTGKIKIEVSGPLETRGPGRPANEDDEDDDENQGEFGDE